MTGTLIKNRGKYYVSLNLVDETTGKRKQKLVSLNMDVKGNAKAAKEAMSKLLAGYDDVNPDVYNKDMLFGDYLKVWLEEKKCSVELITYEGYKSYLDLHMYPYFKGKGVKLQKLNYQHLQDYYDKMGTDKGLSPTSLKRHHAVINQALKAAVKRHVIRYNPAADVTLPKADNFVGQFLSTEEGTLLLDAVKDKPMETPVILAMMYGLRRSEIAGLKWSAIDFKGETITVKHTVVRTKTTIAKDRTKNKSSYRILMLNKDVKAYLLKLHAQQAQDKLLLGAGYKGTEYVCRWPDGHAMECSYLSKAFRKILIKNNLPLVRLHDLRHTSATLLIAEGLDIETIKERLGHSKASITSDIYGHALKRKDKESAAVLDNLFADKSARK